MRSCAWPLLLVVACGDDAPLEPLDSLCADLATDICDARAGCCPGVDANTCVGAETTSCQTELSALEGEALHYNATDAANKRRAARQQLDECGAPAALATFFTGGLADGAPCQRDTQCSGGTCSVETGLCASSPPALCSP